MMSAENRGLVGARFTKYPRWRDPETGEWRALSTHPYFSPCRQIRRRSMFDIDPEWEGHDGLFRMVMYLADLLGEKPSSSRIVALDGIWKRGARFVWTANSKEKFASFARGHAYRALPERSLKDFDFVVDLTLTHEETREVEMHQRWSLDDEREEDSLLGRLEWPSTPTADCSGGANNSA